MVRKGPHQHNHYRLKGALVQQRLHLRKAFFTAQRTPQQNHAQRHAQGQQHASDTVKNGGDSAHRHPDTQQVQEHGAWADEVRWGGSFHDLPRAAKVIEWAGLSGSPRPSHSRIIGTVHSSLVPPEPAAHRVR